MCAAFRVLRTHESVCWTFLYSLYLMQCFLLLVCHFLPPPDPPPLFVLSNDSVCSLPYLKFKELHLGEEQCRKRNPWVCLMWSFPLCATIFLPLWERLNDNALIPFWIKPDTVSSCEHVISFYVWFLHVSTLLQACPQTTSQMLKGELLLSESNIKQTLSDCTKTTTTTKPLHLF